MFESVGMALLHYCRALLSVSRTLLYEFKAVTAEDSLTRYKRYGALEYIVGLFCIITYFHLEYIIGLFCIITYFHLEYIVALFSVYAELF